MRLAVLIVNYVMVALLLLTVMGSVGDTEGSYTIIGVVMMAVPITLSLIYAHMQGGKK